MIVGSNFFDVVNRYLQHFLPDGDAPLPGSSNSNQRKEIDEDSLEGRAKAFEKKRYVSTHACLHIYTYIRVTCDVQESCYTSMIGKSALRSMPHSSGMANILGDADLKVWRARHPQHVTCYPPAVTRASRFTCMSCSAPTACTVPTRALHP